MYHSSGHEFYDIIGQTEPNLVHFFKGSDGPGKELQFLIEGVIGQSFMVDVEVCDIERD